MDTELVEAWQINVETNWMLLDALSKEGLKARYSERTRTVASQFAHIHNVRLSHLDKRGTKKLGTMKPFPRGAQPTALQLSKALRASDKAMAAFLGEVAEAGKVKSWGPQPTSFLGYLLAHEAHHRGLVLVSLRLSGIKLPKDFSYGLWYWSKKRA
jgi:uncharacterized damage-inducible protein DinB